MTIIKNTIEPNKLPKDVSFILSTLNSAGYEAYIIGGCVRDILLGKDVHDYDFASSATPSEVSQIFKDYKQIYDGIKHGTIAIIINSKIYEITTFRLDGPYEDHRNPKNVILTKSLFEDTKRRDFTINQLAYNPNVGLIDYHEGLTDLANGVIRTVGESKHRFTEDALRIMRCFRFASTLGFKIEEATKYWAIKLMPNLQHISGERIYSELKSLLEGDFLIKCWAEISVILDYLLLKPINYYKESFNINCFKQINNNFLERFITLNIDLRYSNYQSHVQINSHKQIEFYPNLESSSKIIEKLNRRLKFSRYEYTTIKSYVEILNKNIEELPQNTKDYLSLSNIYKINLNMLRNFLLAKQQLFINNKSYSIEISNQIINLEEILKYIEIHNIPYNESELNISGNDLIGLGFEPGPRIGQILFKLWEEVVELKINNKKNNLINRALMLMTYNNDII